MNTPPISAPGENNLTDRQMKAWTQLIYPILSRLGLLYLEQHPGCTKKQAEDYQSQLWLWCIYLVRTLFDVVDPDGDPARLDACCSRLGRLLTDNTGAVLTPPELLDMVAFAASLVIDEMTGPARPASDVTVLTE